MDSSSSSSSSSIKSLVADYDSSSSSNDSRGSSIGEGRGGGGVDHILEDIVQALDTWSQRILMLETDLQRNTNIKTNIGNCLQKQVLDGLINRQDANELEYVLDLWTNLHRAYVCKQIGADFADQDILSFLLELFSLKQISKSFFLRVALELCHHRVAVKQEEN